MSKKTKSNQITMKRLAKLSANLTHNIPGGTVDEWRQVALHWRNVALSQDADMQRLREDAVAITIAEEMRTAALTSFTAYLNRTRSEP